MPTQLQTHGSGRNILPSKSDRPSQRPLPPLHSSGLTVQRNDSRTSFKPAKSSEKGRQPAVPVKGQHDMLNHNSNTFSSPRCMRAQTVPQLDLQCTELRHTVDDLDSPKTTSKNKKLPAQLQRSNSTRCLSGSSRVSSSTMSAGLNRSASRSSDRRPSRSSTPCNIHESTHIVNVVTSQGKTYSSTSENQNAMVHMPRRRSSSTISTARTPLHGINQSQTSSLSTSGQGNKTPVTVSSAVMEGKHGHHFAKENLPNSADKCDTSELGNSVAELLQSNSCCAPTRMFETAAEQELTNIHLRDVQPTVKSSSSCGMLGGKGDEELSSSSVRPAADTEPKNSQSVTQHISMVCTSFIGLTEDFIIPTRNLGYPAT